MAKNRLFIDLCFDGKEALIEGPLANKLVTLTCSRQGGVFLTLDTNSERVISAAGDVAINCSPVDFDTADGAAKHPHAMFVDISWTGASDDPRGSVTIADPANPGADVVVNFRSGEVPNVDLDGSPDGTRCVFTSAGHLATLGLCQQQPKRVAA